MDIYIARKGDTVLTAAKRCNLSVLRLAADNGLEQNAPLAEGQAVLVRRVRTMHTVRCGETLCEIAARYGVSVRALYRMNPVLCGLPRLYTGQTLAVRMADTPKRQLQVLGLTRSFPAPVPLRTVLPFLTYVAPSACRTAPNGGLQLSDTSFLFATALDYGVLPLVSVDGCSTAPKRWVETVFYAVMQSDAAGTVTQHADRHARALLAARLSAAERLCLEAFPAISHRAAHCQKGHKPVYISHKQAIALAVKSGATIRFDQTAKQPFFCYRDADGTHTVWFHDVRSWYAQLRQDKAGVTVSDATQAAPFLVFLSSCCRVVE